MSNPFLNKTDLLDRDIETAILLEQAIVTNIGTAAAYTDGNNIFVNTDNNLFKILPAYDYRMLKWILWHEKYHIELRHHDRFYKYIKELKEKELEDKFHVTTNEVNIIMDILVHDSLTKLFPELIEVAQNNLAQLRNRNSLTYTFTTYTLEEMLNEYKEYKEKNEPTSSSATSELPSSEPESPSDSETSSDSDTKLPTSEPESPLETSSDSESPSDSKLPTSEPSKKKGHGKSSIEDEPPADEPEPKEDTEPKVKDGKRPEPKPELPDEHDKTDWSKLKDIDQKEFITKEESQEIRHAIEKLRRKKIKLAKLTETLNGLVTSTRKRTYVMPCSIKLSSGAILKGSVPGRALLYLIFDASGSMSDEMNMFKEIISKSIPQAMQTPCEWFAGNTEHGVEPYKKEFGDGYYKAKFKDFMHARARSGYDDDGDRTIELCWKAEQLGYSPIGVTDGGGGIRWSKDKITQLKRTVLIGPNLNWLRKVQTLNPRIQILDTDEYEY